MKELSIPKGTHVEQKQHRKDGRQTLGETQINPFIKAKEQTQNRMTENTGLMRFSNIYTYYLRILVFVKMMSLLKLDP